jgi:hypothetical protein
MTQTDWQTLHDWLYRIFPPEVAEEDYRAHVELARRNGDNLPTGDLAR